MSSTNRSKKSIFVHIDGFNNYVINQYGEVINSKTGKQLKQYLRKGYLRVCLYNQGERKHFSVHRLVADAFIPNPDNKPQINHIDCDKQNNYYLNLEWCNNSENQIHAWENGLQKRTKNHERQLKKLINYSIANKRTLTNEQVKYIRQNYKKGVNSYKYFAEIFGVSGKTIEKVVKKERYKEVI